MTVRPADYCPDCGTETTGNPVTGTDAADVRFFTPEELDADEYDFRPHVRDRVESALDALD